MGLTPGPIDEPGRRQFFARVVKAIQSTIAGIVGVVAGSSILSPSFARREENWLPVGPDLGTLIDNAPTPATLRIAREDGYSQIVERRVVLLVKTGEGQVTALDPTCTHLGCRVSWDSESKELRCPCHGGDVRPHGRRQGRAAARAAPEAGYQGRRASNFHPNLMSLRDTLLDWLDSRTGWRTGRRTLLEEPIQAGVGWWFVTGSILLLLLTVQFVTGVVLAMFYVPTPDHAYDSIRFITERLALGYVLRGLHFFGASFIVVAAVVHMLRVVALGSYKNPREVTWITGVVLLLLILGVRADRVPAAVGSESVLGHNRHDQHRAERSAGRAGGRPAAGWNHPRVAHTAALVRGARLSAARRACRLCRSRICS